MKKLVVLAALALVAGLVTLGGGGQVVAGVPGGPNSEFIEYSENAAWQGYWMTTRSGLVHNWNLNDPYFGSVPTHRIYKPADLSVADCEAGYISYFEFTYMDTAFPQFSDFLEDDTYYSVCVYPWQTE